MLWEVDIYPNQDQPDREANTILSVAKDLGLETQLSLATGRGYLIQGEQLDRPCVARLARELLADPIVEKTVVAAVGDDVLCQAPPGKNHLVHVLPKPGVTDPVAESALAAMADFKVEVQAVRTLRKYWLGNTNAKQVALVTKKILANEAIEQVIVGPILFDALQLGSSYKYVRLTVRMDHLDNLGLDRLSRDLQLHLQVPEMQAIQSHFANQGRKPTDIELETIAQTWSEHCSHKTLTGKISYRDEKIQRKFDNMLRETIFAATETIRTNLGKEDWCVSVFEDNAGIIRFDERFNVVFKVETHNHPSALEPYGGANTGIGGVLRDTIGTGLGAKPIASTDVFCFAPPDTPFDTLPPGVLHPRRVMQSVVGGVGDYGNRMGVPTVNGAIYFDRRYLGNPLVYCGNVGILPRDKSHKQPQPEDWIVTIGGRTGRDGIHGATFSSAELTSDSELVCGGAVQIGNAITEKMLLDVLLMARDRGLFNAITDCGAGGFSSAVGEMGASLGAEVELSRVPLKYQGLSYREIWISEAQERMVLSVPPQHWQELSELCASEDVEATIIGKYLPTGRLLLKYENHVVGDLSMDFLHRGRPAVVRQATYLPATFRKITLPAGSTERLGESLRNILKSYNVASKEWAIRQYDHEVQGGSVVKPLVGACNDGPSDAAVVRPLLSSTRGIAIGCGMNPCYGDLDTYHMATSAIDEAVRNCVAVGADPTRIALLDNFCWGNCEKPKTLGSLVRASLACHDVAVAFDMPFISGKDSLNNELSYRDSEGQTQSLIIPPSLLISAVGIVNDVRRSVTMDFKEKGNLIYQVGATKDELGGSHFCQVEGLCGGQVPHVDLPVAKKIFSAIHRAMKQKLIRACHDFSEGGLAVAVAEMAFSGQLGGNIFLDRIPHVTEPCNHALATAILLFSESNSRFLCEVEPTASKTFEKVMHNVPHARIGVVTDDAHLIVYGLSEKNTPTSNCRTSTATATVVIKCSIAQLKEAWQASLRW